MTAPPIDFPLAEARSLLIVKPSSLGDIVHTLPAVAAMRFAVPQASISWIANSEWIPLIEGSPIVDVVIPFPRSQFRGARGILGFPGWLGTLSRTLGEVDLVLDFQGLLRSGLMCRASRARCVVGLADSREGARLFHHHRVEVPRVCHSVDRYLLIPEALGVRIPEKIEFPLPPGTPLDDSQPSLPGTYLVLHPYSRGRGKALSLRDVVELCRALHPAPVVLVGVSDAPTPPLPDNVLDLTNRTSLAQLIHVLRGALFTISVDSGPMHLAAAISDRVLGLFSWSDPRLVGPYPATAWVWRNGGIHRRADLRSAAAEPAKKRHGGSLAIDVGQVAGFVRERAGDP